MAAMVASVNASVALVPVPSLDDLARDPSLAGAVPRHAAAALVAAGLVAVSAAAGRLLALSAEPESASHAAGGAPDEWLDAAGVEARFSLSARWLSDHGRALDLHRIRSRPSRKAVRYHVGRLRRFLEAACRA